MASALESMVVDEKQLQPEKPVDREKVRYFLLLSFPTQLKKLFWQHYDCHNLKNIVPRDKTQFFQTLFWKIAFFRPALFCFEFSAILVVITISWITVEETFPPTNYKFIHGKSIPKKSMLSWLLCYEKYISIHYSTNFSKYPNFFSKLVLELEKQDFSSIVNNCCMSTFSSALEKIIFD